MGWVGQPSWLGAGVILNHPLKSDWIWAEVANSPDGGTNVIWVGREWSSAHLVHGGEWPLSRGSAPRHLPHARASPPLTWIKVFCLPISLLQDKPVSSQRHVSGDGRGPAGPREAVDAVGTLKSLLRLWIGNLISGMILLTLSARLKALTDFPAAGTLLWLLKQSSAALVVNLWTAHSPLWKHDHVGLCWIRLCRLRRSLWCEPLGEETQRHHEGGEETHIHIIHTPFFSWTRTFFFFLNWMFFYCIPRWFGQLQSPL